MENVNRMQLINSYPNSNMLVGSIISLNDEDFLFYKNNYLHLFKPLKWFHCRDSNFKFPKFLKRVENNEIQYVVEVNNYYQQDETTYCNYFINNKKGLKYSDLESELFLPATKEEYENYQKTLIN